MLSSCSSLPLLLLPRAAKWELCSSQLWYLSASSHCIWTAGWAWQEGLQQYVNYKVTQLSSLLSVKFSFKPRDWHSVKNSIVSMSGRSILSTSVKKKKVFGGWRGATKKQFCQNEPCQKWSIHPPFRVTWSLLRARGQNLMTQHNKLRLPDLLVINSLAVQVWQGIIYLWGD